MLDSGEAAKNREIQPEAAFDLTSNPGSEWVNSNPRMQIAIKNGEAKGVDMRERYKKMFKKDLYTYDKDQWDHR